LKTRKEGLHDTGLKTYFLSRYTPALAEGNVLKFVFFHFQCIKYGLVEKTTIVTHYELELM